MSRFNPLLIHRSRFTPSRILKNRSFHAVIFALVMALVGGYMLRASHAAGVFVSVEPETGTVSGTARIVTDATASDGAAVTFGGSSVCSSGQTGTPPDCFTPPAGTTKLVFDDEFNGTSIDTTKWAVLNRPGDASNSEAQCYTPNNASESGGSLLMTSKVDNSCAGYGYTSAMLQWKSFNYLYGTIQVRAKESGGTGTWPAEWLLGHNCQQSNITSADNIGTCSWPNPGSDEIDFAEFTNNVRTWALQNIFSSKGNYSCGAGVTDASQNWHVYAVSWQPGVLRFQVDGVTTCTENNASVPSQAMYFITNTAMGGNGVGTINNSTLPQTHYVDYVRVFQ